MATLYTTTTTAQNIMDAVAQDVRQVLSSATLPDSGILLDYVNRTHLEMLRASRFEFLLSPVQQFVTQLGVTDYWLGATGSAGAGQFDTELNLTDIRTIKEGSVFDRSNFRPLKRVLAPPLTAKLNYPDDTSRLGRPAEWRQDPDSPNVLNLYPGSDNQNIYAPQPEPPICTTVAGGSLANRIYFVTTTFTDTFGNESTAPFATKIFVPANFLLVVSAPKEPLTSASGIQFNRYNVYAAQAPVGQYIVSNDTNQQATLISTSTPWTEPITGLVTATANPPGNNNVEPIDGYVIEFRYFKQRLQVTSAGQVLQIPDDYRDVVIAGVNAKTFAYLLRPQEAGEYMSVYRGGLTEIVRDINFLRKDYINPDPASIGGTLPAVESIDLSVLSD